MISSFLDTVLWDTPRPCPAKQDSCVSEAAGPVVRRGAMSGKGARWAGPTKACSWCSFGSAIGDPLPLSFTAAVISQPDERIGGRRYKVSSW